MIHVEARPGVLFCTVSDRIRSDDVIACDAWHAEPESVQRATCPDCLLRLFMLGDSATIALAAMGMKVDVRNEVPEEMQS